MLQQEPAQRIVVMIICIKGQPRNSGLIKALKALGVQIDIRIVEAVEPTDVSDKILFDLRISSEYLLGRKISDIEIATMLSHRKCYELLRKENLPAAYILEDDIDFPRRDIDLLEPLKIVGKDSLRIVTLVRSPWSVWRRHEGLLKAIFPPPCASCYVINLKTANYALSFNPMGLADWPQWSHDVEYLYNEKFNVPIDITNSLIESSRAKLINDHNKWVLFHKSPLQPHVKKIWQFRYVVQYRLLWKFKKLIFS